MESTELIFPQAFEEHLDALYRRIPAYKEVLKETLLECHNAGVTLIKLEVSGEGDDGYHCDIYVYPNECRTKLDRSTFKALEEYIDMLAEEENPGYEINEGGGYRCSITLSPFSVKGEGYYNVIVEEIGPTFSIGADE